MADTTYTDFVGPPVNAAWLNDVNKIVYRSGGTTDNRPATPILYQWYVDTTLGQPIWCIQVTPIVIWVNAAGVQV